uniref:ubiquitinyl hydrolase 1 n=1 Tax=Chenopodium quinoa TaxID=63459 RepID=A0A803ND35_CHEQI
MGLNYRQPLFWVWLVCSWQFEMVGWGISTVFPCCQQKLTLLRSCISYPGCEIWATIVSSMWFLQALASCSSFRCFLEDVQNSQAVSIVEQANDLPLLESLAALLEELSILQEKSRPLNPHKVMSAMQQYIPQFQLSNQQLDRFTLEDCMKRFLAPEHVENYFCSHCWHIAAVKFLSSVGGRQVLCLHLQRSSLNAFGEPVKIQGHICFPIILNLSPFVKYEIGVQKREINKPKSLGEQPNLASISHPKSADKHPELMLVKDDASRFLPEPCSSLIENCSSTISMPTFKANFDPPPPKNILYRLVSVVEHFGRAGSGHYTVYRGMTTQMEKGDGVSETDAPLQWFRISDSEVHNASEEEVLGAEATLLFYERI